MQDEINEKVVALSVKGAKLTAEMLQKAIKAMLAQAKKQQEKQLHGKQTLKQLTGFYQDDSEFNSMVNGICVYVNRDTFNHIRSLNGET